MPDPSSVAAAAARRKSANTGEPRRESQGKQISQLRSPKSPGLSPGFDAGSPGDELTPSGAQHRRSVGFSGTMQGPGRQSPTSPAGSPSTASPKKRRISAAKKRDEDGQDDDSSNNVKVFLRVRPFNQRELKIHEEHYDSMLRSIIDMPAGQEGPINFLEKIGSGDDEDYAVSEVFDFDKGLWSITPEQQPYDFEYATQRNVFNEMGQPALDNAWKGFNTCIFAYGQTGAGKTHTMMGRFSYSDGELLDDPGVIPLLCRGLYDSIEAKRKEDEGKENKLSVITYETELMAYEIYNERVRDLFYFHTPGRKAKDELKVRKHPTEGTFVDGITKLKPETWETCISDVEAGNSGRTVGATAMNSESSRSHSIFQIKFTQVETSIPQARFEKPVINRKYSIINLIDLAGSERNKKSQAAGERLVEATNINLSLTTLKRVIDALVHNGLNAKHPVQIPYRDSVLTMLLSHSLGGNSKTTMVACVSPHYDNCEETLNTLRYASQARRIVNIVRVNEDSKARQNLLLKYVYYLWNGFFILNFSTQTVDSKEKNKQATPTTTKQGTTLQLTTRA